MTCPAGRHESAIPCSPPTDPAGFVYPTYRAALAETQRDLPSLKSSHQGVAYVSSSVGGSVSTPSFEDTTPRNYWSPPTRRGGGIRARVKGFSSTSRRNLLRRLASINRRAFIHGPLRASLLVPLAGASIGSAVHPPVPEAVLGVARPLYRTLPRADEPPGQSASLLSAP
jgi:hypothetical protein